MLLAGPVGHNLGPLHGSWSYTWQGADESKYPESTRTILEAFTEVLGEDNVVAAAVEGFNDPGNYDAAQLGELAADVDYIVLALGERAYAESPGALDDLNLAEQQKELARAAALTGKPVILVLAEGRPRIIRDIEPDMAGIVLAYLPGSQGAQAIADVVFGDYNPNGKLPYSYPQYTGDILPYDHGVLADVQQLTPGVVTYSGYKPQWPFGFGLSYTTFEYRNLQLGGDTMHGDGSLEVSVEVANTGERDGFHSVDLFVSDLYASLSPAARKLRDFDKVFVKAGEIVTVKFELDRQDLEFVNADLQRVVEPGEFRVTVGDLSANFTYQ